ncbi:Bug family tripartite tricarboxylate transporter substrate binding protein [Thermodesulfobacteriota bacterium]
MRRLIFVGFLFVAVCALGLQASSVLAQTYPDRSIKAVFPAPPGSIIDITGRVISEELGKILGTEIIPMNKPGGSLTLGTDLVARSKKDGYTLVYTANAALIYARVSKPKAVPYDPEKDLEPLGLAVFVPVAVAVQANAPWKTFSELVEYSKKNPGKIRISTPGRTTVATFTMAVSEAMTGAKFTQIPFKGGASVITALLGGHVELTYDAVSKIIPHVKSGKLRILLLSKKMAEFPDVPSIRDLGFKQDLPSIWFAWYGPSGMPENVKKALVPAVKKAINNPAIVEKFEKMGYVVDYKGPSELRKLVKEEFKSASEIADKLGLRK